MTLFANLAFFRNLVQTFSGQSWAYAHALSLALVELSVLVILLSLICFRRTVRPVLIFMFTLSAATAYFMDTYNVVIDHDMIANVVATNTAESGDLVTPRLLLYLLLLGALPSAVVFGLRIKPETTAAALRSRAVLVGGALLLGATLIFLSSGFYASFFREHKLLRYFTNPIAPIHAVYRYGANRLAGKQATLQKIGEDARIAPADIERELVIMVVGETARADRFSLNGYTRNTNPQLAGEDVVSFRHMSACGTSTAVSVPCMFAVYGRDDFSSEKADSTENLLDVLKRAGVHILWRDNNSSSKGVADRVRTEDYRSTRTNPVCDLECRDEGMLVGLQEFIDRQATGDILIVLHQMGSHGPAYFKRYPAAYRVFKPTCETSQLDSCSEAEIGNAYDNTILYTDHFLAKVIALLRDNDDRFETAMLYASDHGESLGESGIYLHGLPYFIAPDTQTHVPAILWFGRNYDGANLAAMRQLRDVHFSHDHLFHTLLGMFEIESGIYDPERDLVNLVAKIAGKAHEYN